MADCFPIVNGTPVVDLDQHVPLHNELLCKFFKLHYSNDLKSKLGILYEIKSVLFIICKKIRHDPLLKICVFYFFFNLTNLVIHCLVNTAIGVTALVLNCLLLYLIQTKSEQMKTMKPLLIVSCFIDLVLSVTNLVCGPVSFLNIKF